MRRFGWFLALVVLTVPFCPAGEAEPAKTKSKGDGEILIYEIEVFMGEFYNTDDEYSTDISLSKKGEDGKRKVELDTEGVTQAPIYTPPK